MNPAAQALLEYNEAELQGEAISTIIRGVNTWKSETGEKEVETDCQTKSGKNNSCCLFMFNCSNRS